jgi:endogenous inhibitor of DNA gyrase (YacG/DUF329 family)
MPADRDEPKAPAAPCPICGKPALAASRPFCSNRCADVDLHSWLSGRYAIPIAENEDDADASERDPDDDPGQGGRGPL